jgi:hypothetical protein
MAVSFVTKKLSHVTVTGCGITDQYMAVSYYMRISLKMQQGQALANNSMKWRSHSQQIS